MLHKFFINPIKLAVVALLVVSVSSVMAEWKQSYQSGGNNIGLTVALSYGGPLRGLHQFPRGSGNVYKVGRWNWGQNIVRDTDGDGVVDDTMANLSRGGRFMGLLCALEDYDQLAALAAAGEDMYDASSRQSTNRVYVSSDAGDVAEWPARFREGRTLSGAPIMHGAETICASMGDCFAEDGRTQGASIEYRFHFLNFAESNNMAYMHVFFRNMSEYNKWNPSEPFREKIAGTIETGQTWAGLQMVYTVANGFNIGSRDEAWAYYFPRQIIVQADRNGIESSFTTPPAMMAMMPLRMPEFKGQTLTFTNCLAHGWNTEFGGPTPDEVLEGGRSNGNAYRYGNGRWDATAPYYPDYTSPWTGGPVYGWPGVLEPGDPRYEQWIWGTTNANNSYNFWGTFTDVAPRDSFSIDCAIAFVPPKDPPFTFPPSDITEIDNPMVQDQLSKVLGYMDVAQAVYGGDYVLPETPVPPPLTIIPGEKQVTITWSDVNINTPDQYYYFLQDNPELDPTGQYKEYDFEGYRLYRSYVGPSDSHSEVIMDCSKSAGNLQFYYTDTRDSDNPLFRMNNGMRVWYALVPYDNNYDPGEGKYFSLPDPASGKNWNRPGNQLYTVQPRSNASNFRAASAIGIAYVGPATNPASSVQLAGDGTGNLTEAPQWLTPPVGDIGLNPVNSERITQDKTVYLETAGWWHNGGGCGMNRPDGTRTMKLVDGANETISSDILKAASGNEQTVQFYDAPTDDGISFALDVEFEGLQYPGTYRNGFVHNIDVGTYAGTIETRTARGCGYTARPGTSPGLVAMVRNGRFTVTWKSTAAGMTLEVQDLTRGTGVPAVVYQDEMGWGFMTPEGYGNKIASGRGAYYDETFRYQVPKAERTALMVNELPADYAEEYAIWLNGMVWVVVDGGMPADGTVMTIDNAWGSWNEDKTVFTQVADMPWLGDKWQVDIKAMSQNPDDADLSKVMVVPNPYMASSALDLSPSQRRLEFVNLPARCTIRIYSLGGHLVNVLNHIGANRHGWGDYDDWDRMDSDGNPREFTGYDNHGGTEAWNLQNRFGQTVASGLYFYHVTDERGETHTGKFYVIN